MSKSKTKNGKEIFIKVGNRRLPQVEAELGRLIDTYGEDILNKGTIRMFHETPYKGEKGCPFEM